MADYLPIYTVRLERSALHPVTELQVNNSTVAYRVLSSYLEGADREHFVCIMLDQRNGMIGINTVHIGSLTSSIVAPREVFKPAIVANAAYIIVGHNHPSGDCDPSYEDRRMTERLVEAGKLLGIPVRDHVIIGHGGRYYSFCDDGRIDRPTTTGVAA